MVEQCGEHFRFDREFMAWIRNKITKTLGDLVNECKRRHLFRGNHIRDTGSVRRRPTLKKGRQRDITACRAHAFRSLNFHHEGSERDIDIL